MRYVCLSCGAYDRKTSRLARFLSTYMYMCVVCFHAMQADFLCLLTGVKVMFRVALVLFKSVLGNSQHLAECPGMYEVLDKLRHIPPQYMEQEFLVREVCTSQSGL